MSLSLLAEALCFGVVIGGVLGLTGAGGGILAVPLLVFGLGLQMHEAAPIALLATGLASAIGALLAWRDHLLRYRAALLVAGVGMLTVPLGVMFAHHLPNEPLLLAFAALLMFIAVRNLRTTPDVAVGPPPSCVTNPVDGRFQWTAVCARVLAASGAFCGLLSGLLGVGGGFVIVPALRRYSDLSMAGIVATSMGIVALLSAGAVFSASVAGTMQWPIAAPFAAGAIGGMLLARRLAPSIGAARLQRGFAILCLITAVLLIARTFDLLPVSAGGA